MYKMTIYGKWAETAAKILINASVESGKFAKYSMDEDTAYCRISHKEVNESGYICNPDCVLALDGKTKTFPTNALKIINSSKKLEDSVCIDATSISIDVQRKTGAVSAILGAFVASEPILTLKDLIFGIEKTFDEPVAKRNISAAQQGFGFID